MVSTPNANGIFVHSRRCRGDAMALRLERSSREDRSEKSRCVRAEELAAEPSSLLFCQVAHKHADFGR
jgi:hypothetical protein